MPMCCRKLVGLLSRLFLVSIVRLRMTYVRLCVWVLLDLVFSCVSSGRAGPILSAVWALGILRLVRPSSCERRSVTRFLLSMR